MSAAQMEPLPPTGRVSDRVIRVLGGNPSKFTLQGTKGTNTYILGTGPRRILIDTGFGKPEWISSLKEVLSDESITIEKALLTHWHYDHVGGIADLAAISPGTTFYKNSPSEGQQSITDGQRFAVEGATLKALHTPGHTIDHMCFLLEEENALFTGDNVLGYGTSVFEDLRTYIQSLERMKGAFTGRAYPAHGPVIADGRGKVADYIAHRMMREAQVLRVLRGQWSIDNQGGADGKDGKGWMSIEITRVIYGDLPEEMWKHAEKGIVEVLKKLQEEHKVSDDSSSGRWKVGVGSGPATL
ncbi:MAG: Glycosyl phosphatidyl inositol protein transamidase complex subunit [Chaenotheca gracillima]|nr:MAG: Glycosyl phosphatidyl inositol protein transamidase complex subunit [Chaenotheca gracillima]